MSPLKASRHALPRFGAVSLRRVCRQDAGRSQRAKRAVGDRGRGRTLGSSRRHAVLARQFFRCAKAIHDRC